MVIVVHNSGELKLDCSKNIDFCNLWTPTGFWVIVGKVH
jgi:hypothetical protein